MGRSVRVTTAIAQFMRDLEGAWEAHREALLARRDPAAALATMVAEPSVTYLPAMTGGTGRQAVERFYAEQVLPHLPADLTLSRISRTVIRAAVLQQAFDRLDEMACVDAGCCHELSGRARAG